MFGQWGLHSRVGIQCPKRAVARGLNLAQGTVSKYLNRTRRAGLTWPLPGELDDDVRLESPELAQYFGAIFDAD
jgi:hypothetical protein